MSSITQCLPTMSLLSQTTRNVDLSKSETELATNIRKATSIEETAPKRKHVRACIVYTWDHKSSTSFWSGMKVQPIQADEVQTFKALFTVHKVLQEGHPIALKEAQANTSWLESLTRGMGGMGDGPRGYAPLISEYISFLINNGREYRIGGAIGYGRRHRQRNGNNNQGRSQLALWPLLLNGAAEMDERYARFC